MLFPLPVCIQNCGINLHSTLTYLHQHRPPSHSYYYFYPRYHMILSVFKNKINYKILQKVFSWNGMPPHQQSSHEVELHCNAEISMLNC